MVNKMRNTENLKVKLNRRMLMTMSLVILGGFGFFPLQNAKAIPGILGKRTTPSGGHYNLTNPPPTKRRRISMSHPSNHLFYGLENDDPWFNQGIVRGTGSTTILSLTEPKPLASEGGYSRFLIFDYISGFHTVSIKNHTGWHKGKDIIWTNNN